MKGSKRIVPTAPGPFNLWIYCRGLIRGYVLSLLLFLVIGILLTYTRLGEGIISIAVSVILILSVTYSSIYVTVKIGSKGWLHGAIMGLAYMLILVLLSRVFMSDFTMDKYVMYKLIISIATGSVGGMIGINIK